MGNQVDRLLFAPISAAWLGVLRIGFGAIMFYEAAWFLGFAPTAPDHNQIEALFTGDAVQWTFSYPGLGWVKPLPEPWTTGLFVVLAIASGLMVLGICYRVAAWAVFAAFSYINSMDASIYLNHFYLMCVIAFLMAVVPADRRFTIRGFRQFVSPGPIPQWTILIFRFQVFAVYFFAGIAKLNRDWLAGEPLRRWLPHTASAKTLEPWIGETATEAVRLALSADVTVMTLSYGGILFDLLVGFFLLSRKTRTVAFCVAVLFHATNFIVFDIGAFPVMAVLLTTVFFDPEWPDRLARHVRIRSLATPLIVPPPRLRTAVLCGLSLWVGVHCLLPLRHYFIPGNVSWTEEGHRFSWRMKLRDKVPGPFVVEIAAPAASDIGEHVDAEVNRIFQDVTAWDAPWKELPPLVVTYEPLLGERLIFNPSADETWTDALNRARNAWRAATGRELKLQRGKRFAQAIATARQQVQATHPEHAGEFDRVEHAFQALRVARGPNRRQMQLALQDRLFELIRHAEVRKLVLKQIWQTLPFACQGAEFQEDLPFMVAVDAEMIRSAEFACTEIDHQRAPDMGPVLVDLRGLAPSGWRALPHVVPCDAGDGRTTMIWNYRRDLHAGQLKAVRSSPLLQHEYAQHVANRWEDRYGVRPNIYVESFAKLNQHAPQRMVDHQVDLASEDRRIWRRNAWILPLKRSSARLGAASRRQTAQSH